MLAIIPAIRRTIENDFRLSRMQVTGNGVIREACNGTSRKRDGLIPISAVTSVSIFLSYP